MRPFSRRNPRRKVARELLNRMLRGPEFFVLDDKTAAGAPFTPEEALSQVRSWIYSCIEPDLRDLLAKDLEVK